jgi:DNA-binding transcriptional LysR family regulator
VPGVDLDAVRTFVAAADSGRFQDAADELSLSQQAVSKRIAGLEAHLGVRLFTRTPRGARLSVEGAAFLPHARSVLDAVARAADAVRPGRRPLRVDVLGRRLAAAGLLRDFHLRRSDVELEVHTLHGERSAVAAVLAGAVDAAFCTGRDPLPDPLVGRRVLDEPIELLVGPRHPLAGSPAVAPAELAGHRIWIPAIVPGTEWADFYAQLAAAFGLTIDAGGPNLGLEHVQDAVGAAADLATFVGAGTRLASTSGAELRRVPLRDPAPVWRWSVVHRGDNRHPALRELVEHLVRERPPPPAAAWTPSWATGRA